MVSLLGLQPGTYEPHPLHRGGQTYTETNCYTDIIIELLHARGDEAVAALGTTVRLDFEGDQWTFFKPSPNDLELLFGVDIHEMQPYRAIPAQIEELIGAGRTMIVELDSWYLPDTIATSYRTEHVKTSVVAEAIDPAGEKFRYFHNTSLHELRDEDYRGVFRLAPSSPADDVLPPYAELVRFDAGPRLHGEALRAAARESFRQHLRCAPADNPFDRFRARFQQDLPALLSADAAEYHAYAFATLRMAGAGFQLLAAHVDWLLGPAGERASAALRRIVDTSRLLNLKLARRRPFDADASMDELSAAWGEALADLHALPS